jgi:hypothetical protein
LFHIRGERWTWPVGYREIDLGHAISRDLRTWTPQEPVLPAGPLGAWDESGNWAPDIIEVEGVYYLYYTGSDRNNNQKIGLATSTDLYSWTKHPANPLVEPGPWSDREMGRDVAGRDGMVYFDAAGRRYLMYYTATMADGRACLALAGSTDLIHWEDLGPTYIEEDRSYNRLESAYLVPHEGQYYLFYSAKGGPKSKGFSPEAFDHFEIVYVVSDDPTGGWRKPANHLLLEKGSCASEHPTFDGTTYMFYIIQEEINGIWGASVLSDPKQVAWQPDGTVQIREVPPNKEARRWLSASEVEVKSSEVSKTSEVSKASPASATPDLLETPYREWISQGGNWESPEAGFLVAPGNEAYLMDTLWGSNLALEAEVWLPAGGMASLMVRGNPSAMAGYRVSLDVERQRVGLYLRFPGEPDRPLQERRVELQPERWYNLKVVVQGRFFEVYLDGILYLVRDHDLYDSGCFGLHAQGAGRFRQVQAYHYPEAAAPDWQRRCRPRQYMKREE